MKIGVISDTHDHIPNVNKAIEIFNNEKVDLVIHAGDIVSPFMAPKCFKNLNCPLKMVYGNNDGDLLFLEKKFAELDVKIEREYLEIEIDDGKKIITFHTIQESILDAMIKSNNYSVIIYGHSHEKEVKKIGNTLVVNPGECCGYLTDEPTIAIIDLEALEAEIIQL
ncbi:MAG: YfcE family phosphodiesterase [Candidatus Lokiarchaeota archaeon]|nr:YfcE family phosphodiesterase [Candidatus Lokiarchaeota archaeon]